eukprot:TRINITY_DN16882_c0_g1_i1.p1 TRINITY_DN16882_c0_g1~~TRINITY_DN16882_c0_g1_i1.p1  ORF type:complete len:601 (-),score=115.34 TRINITY_DN16882_c0_g1_i1:108-1910(-)
MSSTSCAMLRAPPRLAVKHAKACWPRLLLLAPLLVAYGPQWAELAKSAGACWLLPRHSRWGASGSGLSSSPSSTGARRGLIARFGKGKKNKEKTKEAAPTETKPNEVKITPRSEDYSAWYLDIIDAADLVADAPVRGCKIYKPGGFAIWESIQRFLDPQLKAIGVQNAYFPLLIPVSFLSREASHVAGFAKECAVVTHHRLKATEAGDAVEVDPDSQLAEPYVIRPTSETVIWHMYGQWIRSHRDLPLKMNQWANVMRWELRTRPFLRSAEFLWQEGHTAHATKDEADGEARKVLGIYTELAQTHLAMATIPGRKSENERFAGADETYTIEVLAQDGKAIQAGTSHFLGQNFAKAFDVTYLSEQQTTEYVWSTSWGVSTRLIGAVIMSHSDDDGVVLPPAIAATQVVIVPMYVKDPEKQAAVSEAAEKLMKSLQASGIRVHMDDRLGIKPGAKYFEWERKGVPLRLELGPRDLEKGVALGKLRTGGDKFPVELGDSAPAAVQEALEKMRNILVERSNANLERLTFKIESRADFDSRLATPELGFLLVPWGGDNDDEDKIQDETGATLRCYPLKQDPMPEGQLCPLTGKPAREWAIFAKAY